MRAPRGALTVTRVSFVRLPLKRPEMRTIGNGSMKLSEVSGAGVVPGPVGPPDVNVPWPGPVGRHVDAGSARSRRASGSSSVLLTTTSVASEIAERVRLAGLGDREPDAQPCARGRRP